MKTIARLDRDIVTFDNNALYMNDIHFIGTNSVYSYRMDLSVNVVRAIREQAKTVEVEVLGIPRGRSGNSRRRFSRGSPNKFLRRLKRNYATSFERRKNKRKSMKKIYSRTRKISYGMNYRQYNKIYRSVDLEDIENFLNKKKVLSLVSKSMLTPDLDSSIVKAIQVKFSDSNNLEINSDSDNQFPEYDSVQFKNDCLDLIRKEYVDPSRISTLRHSIIKRPDVARGLNNSNLAKRRRRKGASKLKLSKYFLSKTSEPSKETILQSVPEEERALPFRFNVSSFHLSKYSRIIIKYDVIDVHGGVVQRSKRVLNHKKLLSEFNAPILAPAIRVSPRKDAYNVVSVRLPRSRNAKFIKGFKVYKKTYPSSGPDNRSNFIKLFEGEFNRSRSRKRRFRINRSTYRIRNTFHFRDVDVSSNPIVYRVVPVDFLGREYSCFKTAVVKPFPPKKSLTTETNRNLYLSSHGSNKQDSTSIYVNNFDSSIIMIEIFRRNLTLKEKKRKPYNVFFGDLKTNFLDKPAGSFEFEDRNVKEDNIYEYSYALTFKDGFRSFSSQVLINKFMSKNSEVLVDIQKLNYGQNEKGKIDVSFIPTTSKAEKQKESDMTRKLLSKINADTLFSDEDITRELKDNIPDLVSFRITRRNLVTNEEVTFNQSSTNQIFIDSASSLKAGVKTVEYGEMYKYTVKAYKISPKVAFRDSRFDYVSPRTGKRYKSNFSKFKNNLTIKASTIKPFTKFATRLNYNRNPFLLGETGCYDEIVVDLSNKRPSIVGGSVNVEIDNKKTITWELGDGDLSTIDFFLIICHIDGYKIPCFVAQGYKDGDNDFEYIENFTRNIPATIGYSIVPIYNNFDIGKEHFLGTVDSLLN